MEYAEFRRRLHIAPKALWEPQFFDDEFRAGLYRAVKIRIIEHDLKFEGTWPELKIRRTLVFEPDRHVPKPLLALVRGVTQVREVGTFDAAANSYEVQLTVPVVGRRVDFRYVYSWQEPGPEMTELHLKSSCSARLAFLSGKAEQFLTADLLHTMNIASDYTRDWFKIEMS